MQFPGNRVEPGHQVHAREQDVRQAGGLHRGLRVRIHVQGINNSSICIYNMAWFWLLIG